MPTIGTAGTDNGNQDGRENRGGGEDSSREP